MDTNKISQSDTPQISSTDVDTVMRSALGAADASSAETMQNITYIQHARLSRMQRNLAALKQAGADASTLQQAESSIKAGKERIAQLSVLHQQAATPAPSVSPSGWALHGRVLNASFVPAEHLTVFLVDANKTWQRQYGFAYTDSTGYFLINYAGETAPKAAEAQPGSKPAASQAAGTAAPQLFIEIANAQGKPIYLATDPFSPTAGSITYQTITLPAGQKPIGDPPADLRDTAIPPRKKK